MNAQLARRLAYLEAHCEETGSRMGPELADELDELREIRDAEGAQATPGLGDRDTAPVWVIYRGKLDEIAGRPVTDEEVSRIATALEFSSIPDAISDVIFSVCGCAEDED